MRGRLAAGRLAALLLGALIAGLGIARSARASALEWELPGERKLSIHGFYEMRLLFVGEDLPANDVTFSQFRHVLSSELEFQIAPDGFGPFDSMFLYARGLASFDCIYSHACGIWSSADSYGPGTPRVIRQPASLKQNVVNKAPYFGGLLPMKYLPGTLAPSQEILNPSRRYRNCANPAGTFQNPFPLAAFCNLNTESVLDGPLKPGLSPFIEVRAGSFARLSRANLLTAARPSLGEAEYTRIYNLLANGDVLTISQDAERRGLLAEAAQADKAGDKSLAKQLRDQAANILGDPATDFDANIPELLHTRPDPNRFAVFGRALSPQLLSSEWGTNKIGSTILPFLASIDTPIDPKGYFSSTASLNWYGSYEAGLADDMSFASIAGAPTATDKDGLRLVSPELSFTKAIPFIVGPDGLRDTADDLPYVSNNPRAGEAGYVLAAPIAGTAQDRFDVLSDSGFPIYTKTAQIVVPSAVDPSLTKQVELYGVYNPEWVTQNGCQFSVHGTFNPTTGICTDPSGKDATQAALAAGCPALATIQKARVTDIGVNADGDCIEVNTTSNGTARVQYEVLGLLADPRARPSQASNEPLDATDLRLYGNEGVTLPARPRNKTNGIVFQSPGAANFYDTHRKVVSYLDEHFSVDELQWNHGASQQEREFAEGYLEFEMFDSQLFARVGKQYVIWGKTEFYRNQDRANPIDLGNGLFPPFDEARIGQWSVDMTLSPEMFMRVGPVEDLRLELLWIMNQFTPTDIGKCGEGSSVELNCLRSFGAIANGLAGIGILGESRPTKDYHSWGAWDYGARVEGRLDRFTFAVSDFWGWDDTFILNVQQQYQRTADFTSGAPLTTSQIHNGGHCKVRTNSAGQAVGPNGIPGDGDDEFASDGNCLLWDKPDANGQQHLRAPEAIASLQQVNQTLFHSICSFTFDQDDGYCAFDRLNNPDTFDFISALLGGLGFFGGLVLNGTETIHTANSPLESISSAEQLTSAWQSFQFMAVNPKGGQDFTSQDLGLNLQTEQAALLGCGAAYANPCSRTQARIWQADPAISGDFPNGQAPNFGGIDLMNADGSVVTQEFTGLKALSPGALVGTRTNPKTGEQVYLPGINYSRNIGSFKEVPDIDNGGVVLIETGQYLDLTPNQVIKMGRVGRAEYQKESDPNSLQADGWIEPMPWKVDAKAKQKWGAIVFQNDPNAPFDLKSPLNVWNTIDKNNTHPTAYDQIDGEYCARWMNISFTSPDPLDPSNTSTPFNHGCTALETASANFERLLIATEIIGFDRVFDPPESLGELYTWGLNNTALQPHGDPISGPDGIFLTNQFVFNDEEEDFQVLPKKNPQIRAQLVIAPSDKEAALNQLRNFDPNVSCLQQQTCYYDVSATLHDENDAKSRFPLVLVLPIGYTVDRVVVDEPNDPNTPAPPPIVIGQTKVNLARLENVDRHSLLALFAGQPVTVNGSLVQMSKSERESLLAPTNISTSRAIDLDQDNVNDLDQDRDGVWDGQDDYSPGPVTDDNILCGSGVRGDPFQEAAQYEPYRLDEAPGSAKFKTKFPNGLPPRSPTFCKSIAGILGGTTQTLPVRKAGGDGTYGRRDFLWQGGREVSLGYQKKNVFGFGLDFAEDVTKTSWGVEFSWTARKQFGNSLTYSGLSQSDQLVLSVSVDRPTFFNFINPNRSFFMNLQMFVSYLPHYQGGTLYKDGNYGTQKGPFSGNVVFTFFTGYFQDRLAPRLSVLYAPLESQGAIITGLSYRWNDAFITSLGYSNFFGHVYNQQGSYFPIAQYGSTETYQGATFRGIAPVINRDQAEVRFRYTW